MNVKMLGIGAIAVVAAIMIAGSCIGTDDVSAKTRHDRSYAQSSAVSNECPAFQDDDNSGNQAGTNELSASTANCIGDINMIQDSDGAAVTLAPTQTGGILNVLPFGIKDKVPYFFIK